MIINVWPFLISRNEVFDYKTIVAPDFMCEAGSASLLADAAGGDLTSRDEALYRELRNTKSGNLTLMFQVNSATDGEEILTDGFGRPIVWIYGIVLQGLLPNVGITREDLAKASSAVEGHFREFWLETVGTPAKPSQAFEISGHTQVDNLVTLKILPPFAPMYLPPTRPAKSIPVSKSRTEPISSRQARHYEPTKHSIDKIITNPTDGSIVVLQENARAVLIWDFAKRKSPFEGKLLNAAKFGDVAIRASDEKLLIVENSERQSGGENRIWLWDMQSQENVEPTKPVDQRFCSIDVNSSGELLVCGMENGAIYLWDFKLNKWILKQIQHHEHRDRINSIVFNPTGDKIASGRENSSDVMLCNVANCNPEGFYLLKGHTGMITTVAFNLNGTIVASGSTDKTIKFWDVENRSEICTLVGHTGTVNALAFSPDGQTLASASNDSSIRLWNVAERKESETLFKHKKEVTTVCFNKLGSLLISGGKDGFCLWDMTVS